MAAKERKILLFIVEGATDEYALSPVMKRLFQNDEALFHVVRGDLTAERRIAPANVLTRVNDCVQRELSKYRFMKSDVLGIIHLADTDGAFVPDDAVTFQQNESVTYYLDHIETATPQTIVARNRQKASVMRRLAGANKLSGIPYRFYFLSRNLEHVLHNDPRNLTDAAKTRYADLCAERFAESPASFVQMLSTPPLAVPGDHAETWRYIALGLNSLHRHSNLHLVFANTSPPPSAR